MGRFRAIPPLINRHVIQDKPVAFVELPLRVCLSILRVFLRSARRVGIARQTLAEGAIDDGIHACEVVEVFALDAVFACQVELGGQKRPGETAGA